MCLLRRSINSGIEATVMIALRSLLVMCTSFAPLYSYSAAYSVLEQFR